MKMFLAASAVVALSGCSTLETTFANRVACSVAKDQAFSVSMYGPIGIASKIAEQDGAVLCGQAAVAAKKVGE